MIKSYKIIRGQPLSTCRHNCGASRWSGAVSTVEDGQPTAGSSRGHHRVYSRTRHGRAPSVSEQQAVSIFLKHHEQATRAA